MGSVAQCNFNKESQINFPFQASSYHYVLCNKRTQTYESSHFDRLPLNSKEAPF